MLDNETKSRIDSARDILVGKIPDPKAQVEQITTALIYKFMDDMDKESVELGGKPQFFTDGFGEYAWTKLMNPRLGGFDRMNLYVEAITKMSQNPNIPTLFRTIFKDAFLPYRDPETLNLFLKEINGFVYDHSERLGDAFEYLLSVLGSQGEAGQFRTPRHIIDFMVEIIAPDKNETILDPACGTAGFLISSFKHIMNKNKKNRPGDLLTTTERKNLMKNTIGYDISPDMVRISLVNMYLHGFPEPKISEYDTLTYEDRWDDMFDVILANPPFMSPKGGIRPHKRFSVQSKRSEVLFVDYIAEHLLPNGRAAVIVPEGVIFQSGTAYKQLRKMLVENYLFGVVSLPAGVFNPYSGVKTSILLMDKTISKRTDKIIFIKVENDGFDLGAQRRPINKNDLPEALKNVKSYLKSAKEGKEFDANEIENVLVVEKEKIGENGECNLSGERYAEAKNIVTEFKLSPLSKICSRVTKNITPSEYTGSVKYIGLENITSNTGSIVGNLLTDYLSIKSTKTVFQKHDVLYGKLRPNLNKVHLSQFDGICSTDILVYKANEKCIPAYLSHIMRSTHFNSIVLKGIGGAQLPRTSAKYLEQIKIPLPPLAIQKEIVAEIESYQKIIDGARQVVENYKPQIQIDPEWEMVELGEVCEKITDGTHRTPKYTTSGIPFYRVSDITNINPEKKFISKKEHLDLVKRCKPEKGDILYSKNGTIGVAKLVDWDFEFSIFVSLALLKPLKKKLIPKYLEVFLNTENALKQAKAHSKSGTVTNLHLIEIKQIKIPLPDIKTQNRIVSQIEKEQQLVNANKELIKTFEQKIKDRIARVWGE